MFGSFFLISLSFLSKWGLMRIKWDVKNTSALTLWITSWLWDVIPLSRSYNNCLRGEMAYCLQMKQLLWWNQYCTEIGSSQRWSLHGVVSHCALFLRNSCVGSQRTLINCVFTSRLPKRSWLSNTWFGSFLAVWQLKPGLPPADISSFFAAHGCESLVSIPPRDCPSLCFQERSWHLPGRKTLPVCLTTARVYRWSICK